jgi:bacterioferritin (cytochrome b1)
LAINSCSNNINVAVKAVANNTKVLLDSIPKEKEEQTEWIEAQLDQIKRISVGNYLVEQVYWQSDCIYSFLSIDH